MKDGPNIARIAALLVGDSARADVVPQTRLSLPVRRGGQIARALGRRHEEEEG